MRIRKIVSRSQQMKLFIVVEGLDGTGKSTLIASLAYVLKAFGRVHVTAEPYVSPTDGSAAPLALHSADDYMRKRAQHVQEVIAPFLRKRDEPGRHAFLLCDRYVLSTAAYNSRDEIEARHLLDVQKMEFPLADITLLLHVPIDHLEHRLDARAEAGVARCGFDDATRAEKERIQNTYLSLMDGYPDVVPLDARCTSQIVLAAALSAILKELTQDMPKNEIQHFTPRVCNQ